MTKQSPLAASCLLIGMIATGAVAQDATTPFAAQSGLGDHIASRVLNMNGYNITNLNDPFFEGDAVTLGYFNRNSGWNHKATADMDFGGFDMINIGDVTLDGSTLRGGTFEATALTHPKITGGSFSGISMRNAAIEVPRVTGGTFEAPALLSPSIDKASLTGGEMVSSQFTEGTVTDSDISGGTITSSELLDVSISGAKITDDVVFEGARLTGLSDPEDDSDAMSLAATKSLIAEQISYLEAVIEGLKVVQPAAPSDGDEEQAVAPALPDFGKIIAGLDSIPGDVTIDGALVIDGSLSGVVAQYRPTPTKEDALGVLDGSDILSSLRSMDAVVYNLPGGGLAAGIDPETVPAEMSFILKGADDGYDSIDYTQMIGPMIATIKHMDARIQELEAKLSMRP